MNFQEWNWCLAARVSGASSRAANRLWCCVQKNAQIFVKKDKTLKQALDAFVDQYCSEIDARADKLIKGLMTKAEEIRKANPQ